MKTVQKTNNEGILYETLKECKEGNEAAYDTLFRMNQNRIKHCIFNIYNVYGKRELSYKGVEEEEFWEESRNILRDIVRRLDFEILDKKSPQQKRLVLASYLTTSLSGDLKKFAAKRTGVKRYYLDILVNVKKAGMDIWSTDDRDLCMYLQESRKCKDPNRLLYKLRNEFPNPDHEEQKKKMRTDKEIYEFIHVMTGATVYNAKWLVLFHIKGIDLWNNNRETLLSFIKAMSQWIVDF